MDSYEGDVDYTQRDRIESNRLEAKQETHLTDYLQRVLVENERVKRNKKDIAHNHKDKTAAVPPISILALGKAMQLGADKYGRFNWRTSEVRASVFYNAIMRHLLEWYSGKDFGKEEIHHLAHIMANCAILLDAEVNNCYTDDRPSGKPLNTEEPLWNHAEGSSST